MSGRSDPIAHCRLPIARAKRLSQMKNGPAIWADPFRSLIALELPAKVLLDSSERLKLRRGQFAGALVLLEVEAHLLAFLKASKASALHRRDVDKHISAASFRLDEAVAFLLVEPFNSTGSHVALVFR
jgi:hypothetical protein